MIRGRCVGPIHGILVQAHRGCVYTQAWRNCHASRRQVRHVERGAFTLISETVSRPLVRSPSEKPGQSCCDARETAIARGCESPARDGQARAGDDRTTSFGSVAPGQRLIRPGHVGHLAPARMALRSGVFVYTQPRCTHDQRHALNDTQPPPWLMGSYPCHRLRARNGTPERPV